MSFAQRRFSTHRVGLKIEQNRTEFDFVRAGKSNIEATNNKRRRSRYCTAEPNYRHEASRGLSATAELLVFVTYRC